MRKSLARKGLAMLLCLCMVLSVFPAAALAVDIPVTLPEQGELAPPPPAISSPDDTEKPQETQLPQETATPEEATPPEVTLTPDPVAPTEDEVDALETDVPQDGVNDTWTQSSATVYGSDAVCKKENGKLTLKAGSGNGNNAGAKPSGVAKPLPAMFVDAEMTTALAAAEGEKTISFKMTPRSAVVCFGIFLNYAEPATADNAVYGMALIYNTTGGWNAQHYYGTADIYPAITGLPLLVTGTEYTFEVKWTDSMVTSIKVNGAAGTIANNGADFKVVTDSLGIIDKVGFKLGKYGVVTETTISDVHYTGQAKVTAYDISGKVTDHTAGTPIAGATVTLGGKTATTGADGVYDFKGIVGGVQRMTVTKEGYSTSASDYTVSADQADHNVTLTLLPTAAGTVTDATTKAAIKGAVVTYTKGDLVKTALTDATGAYTIIGLAAGDYIVTASAENYQNTAGKPVTVTTENLVAQDIAMATTPTFTLSTAAMDVTVDPAFPRAIRYTMKGENAGKVFYGQTNVLDTIKISGVPVKPTVTSQLSKAGDKVDYQMSVVDAANNIDAMLFAEIVVKDNTLSFNITDVLNNLDRLVYPVESIEIPNQSLVSVRSTQEGANFKGARLAANTITSGDSYAAVDTALDVKKANNQRYFTAFVSNNELSAGLAGNSDYGTSNAGKDTYAVMATAEDKGAYKTLGLGSPLWYYDRKTSSSDPSAQMNRDLKGELSVVGPVWGQMPLFAKVVIAGEGNGDGQVDWQDGAIAYRDTVMHIPAGSEEIPDVVSTRIAMNFGSQAQNPFLTTLDNAKRIALHTDGLGQSILLKGYGNEGHDSGHPDYADVGRRMGGVEDFNTLTKEGKKIGARFGIHINASEFYPEAKAFSDQMVYRYDAVAPAEPPLRYGWNWIDQGIGINGLYDLATGNRSDRFKELYKAVGNYAEGGLDFVYVDVWGNNTSGKEDSWQTRKLSQDIISNGWRIAHEWSWANPYESTFQHWTSDFPYGSYADKGSLNSEVMRFLLNDRKDSFVADFAWYGGAANAPLLGGPSMQGFEGWQGDGEYNMASYNIFNQMIPTKFLQHYDIMKWTNNDDAVAIPYSTDNGGAQSNISNWTPEVQIRLENGTDKVVVTRGLDGEIDETYVYGTPEEQVIYRSRNITLNGKTILNGAPKAGDFKLPADDTMQYLIPWFWDANGKAFTADEEKLYHWNAKGGESTWELPASWAGLASVKLYELSDHGRLDEVIVPVTSGKITLTAKGETPYVVTRGAAAPAIEWSTGLHLRDVSFNSGALAPHWTTAGKGAAGIFSTELQIPMLKLTGEVSVSQKFSDLTPGQNYAVYVGVDNRSDAKATMTVTAGATVLATNYTEHSIAQNYISAYAHHTGHAVEQGASYFQNMYVFFTAPAEGETTLTLSRAAGAGNTYFDDVRVLETKAQNYTRDAAGNVLKFTQDFENSAQGQYPFVVGPIEGVADNRQHLSEKHAPYTQAGWDVKKMDDVIEGDWSLKVNGLVGRNSLVFQTVPQTFRFEPGVTYNVSFQYQMGSEGLYQVVTGAGPFNYAAATKVDLKKSLGTTATCNFTVVGDATGQTWIGVYSTNADPDYMGASGAAQSFGGYKEIVVDNLAIEVAKANKNELAKLLAVASTMQEVDYAGSWTTFVTLRTSAQKVMNNQTATQGQIDGVVVALQSAMDALVRQACSIKGTVTENGQPVAGALITLEGTNYAPEGHTAITDAAGKYEMADLSVKTYKLKITSHGYQVQTTANIATVADTAAVADITLVPVAKATYVNNFDNGDVSMMQALESKDQPHMSTEAVQHDGSGAAKITFISSSDRSINNLVDKTIKMKDGALSADITPVGTGTRFGFTLRGTSGASRVFVGQFDTEGVYGWEYWGPNGTKYSTTNYNGPALSKGVTRHLELELTGNTLTLKVDGVTIMNSISLASGQTTPPAISGYVGFNKERSTGSQYIIDNFHLTSSDPGAVGAQQVSGTVLGEADAPLVDAVVTLMQGDSFFGRTTTSLDGTYLTAAVPAGTYSMTISAQSYATQTVEVVVTDAPITDKNVTLVVDATQLQALYAANKDKTQGHYTAESWATFQLALTQAKAALEAPKAANIVKAYNELSAAITALVETPLDMSLLRTYYNSFNGYLAADYSPETWAPFQAALRAASELLGDSDTKQDQVDAACTALVAAEAALVKVSGEPEGPGDNTGNNGGSSNTTTETVKNDDGSTSVIKTDKKTGTVTDTTTAKDGTKSVTETKKDGTVTSTVTLTKTTEGNVILPVKPLPAGTSTITVKTGAPANVTIPVEKGNAGIVVYLVKADGTEELVKKSVTGKDGITLSIDGSLTLKVVDNSKSFADVLADGWAADAVGFATSRELFQGTAADAFSPSNPMTRAMLATVLYRLENEPKTGANSFTDVAEGTWYAPAVAWASETGIVTGDGNGFAPNGNVTREALTVMLYRYAQKLSVNTATEGKAVSEFGDSASISGWAKDAMSWAVGAGVLTGKTDGNLAPTGTATRAEVATMLMRFVGLL